MENSCEKESVRFDKNAKFYNSDHRVVCWFSCGAASAVATKMSIEGWKGKRPVHVVYCDTMSSEHPDNQRFFDECQEWFGVKIEKIKSRKYRDVDEILDKNSWWGGWSGAICTTELKKVPRKEYERWTDTHVFGFTSKEKKRAKSFEEKNPNLDVEFPLIDFDVSNEKCLKVISDNGIDIPVMYRQGFKFNNCIGCIKSSNPSYWNKIRHLYPEVFDKRAKQSRKFGKKLVVLHGYRISLDDLMPDEDYDFEEDIECGVLCNGPTVDSQGLK